MSHLHPLHPPLKTEDHAESTARRAQQPGVSLSVRLPYFKERHFAAILGSSGCPAHTAHTADAVDATDTV